MVDSVGIEDAVDKNGNPLRNTDSVPANMVSRYTNHCQYTKFENSATIADYACERNIAVQTVTISRYTSICETILVDITKTKLADYDPIYGIDFDVYTKGRQYLIVVDHTGFLDSDLPADGTAYDATNQVVIFSGYNKPGSALDINDIRVSMQWCGVENLLDEIKISGSYIKNVATPNWPASGSVGLKVLSSQPCIFNENGRGDRTTQYSTDEANLGKFYFNKSGLKHATTWTLEQIFKYVTEWYTKSTSEIIALDRKLGLDLITYISNYIDVEYRDISNTDFALIVPYDFNLEGLSVMEAYIKIFEESKKYTMYKAYTNSGKVTISYRLRNADATLRGTDDLPMKIEIGVQDAVPTSTIVFNDGNINLNRETRNVGRVVVMGDFLCINTLMTSCAYPAEGSKAAFSGNFSTNKDTYSAIAGLTTFTDRISLVLSDTQRTGDVNEQTYIAVPTNSNMIGLTIADVTADLNTYHTASNQEAETTKIFDQLKALKINRLIDNGMFEQEENKIKDIGVYVAHPSESEVRSPETNNYVYPTIKVASDTFYFITPIENVDINMEAKIDTKDHSAIFLHGTNLEDNTDSGQNNFYEYLYKSPLLPFEAAYGFDNYNVANPAPIWVRANVQTDYRIKGIATITSVAYDPNVHHTMIVYDDDFKLSLNYKDALYDGAGSFANITNGYIIAGDSAVLQKIQEKADSLLDKYLNVQNSGYSTLNGVQYHWKIGDWTNKFVAISNASSNARDILTPVVVNSIVFDFQQKKTTLFFGVDA